MFYIESAVQDFYHSSLFQLSHANAVCFDGLQKTTLVFNPDYNYVIQPYEQLQHPTILLNL